MALDFVSDKFDVDEAKKISNKIEYNWNNDSKND